MSQGTSCKCPESRKPWDTRRWGVAQRHQRRSAFDGYQPMHSDYSCVICVECRATWRTKAFYVHRLPTLVFDRGDFRFQAEDAVKRPKNGGAS